MPGQVSSTLS
ncbi:hypothetical protein GBAR_LOCUS12596 [Geodia barretti]|uniref:Uncharacterized protein n=1 Tax=Geodia barretti TaxID=519541 RepID=A0AA35WH50_GEOBA|nr:hypothetical protein GBAR_LOCUS12596 [Geodia barretti]